MSAGVDIAVVAGGFTIIAQAVATTAAYFNSRAERAKLAAVVEETHRIVKGNGKGDVSIMLANVIDKQEEMSVWQENHDVEHVRLTSRARAIAKATTTNTLHLAEMANG